MSKRTGFLPLLFASAIAVACSGGGDKTPPSASPGAAPTGGAAAPAVAPTGHVITIELFSDEKGNYFRPSKIEAHRGDVLRFTLRSGVHNVHFLPDSNPGAQGLPAASEFLQLPDQTWDFAVNLAHGHYYFQCDPHALLGMIGHLEVEDDK